MFKTLHALADKATLMITVAREGDDQLRVNLTPVPFDTKAKASLPQPLSLVATPDEFDADFGAALLTWQAPKRSLVEQAQGAAPAAPALPAPKSDGKTEKAARKARGTKTGDDEKKVDGVPAAAAAAGDAAAAADQAMADSAKAEGAEEVPAVTDLSSANTSTDVAVDKGAQQADDTPAVDAGAAAPAGQDPVAEPVGDDEPVDKFTLDLF